MDAFPEASVKEVEIALLDLRYAHTRVIHQDRLLSLAVSLDACGQIRPVVLAAPYVLIDGYRRVEALKICGKETVMAQVWGCAQEQALLDLLCGRRKWDVVEEAAIIRELVCGHGFTQAQVARKLCKDPSWVDRRLSLLDSLPEEILDSVKSGRVSSWAASRVLAPLARANSEHASALNDWIVRERVSTRDLSLFFDHYKRSAQRVRERMVGAPSLFLKSHRAKELTKEAGKIRDGPEGKWMGELADAAGAIRRLAKSWETIMYCHQGGSILATLDEMLTLIAELNHKIRSTGNDHAGDDRSHPDSGAKGNGHPPDQCGPEDIAKHGETGAAGARPG